MAAKDLPPLILKKAMNDRLKRKRLTIKTLMIQTKNKVRKKGLMQGFVLSKLNFNFNSLQLFRCLNSNTLLKRFYMIQFQSC